MILVTGGTGFIGAYLLRELVKQGRPVRAIRRPSSKMGMVAGLPGIEWVVADILHLPQLEEAMQGVTKVYHSAAIVSYDKRDRDKMMAVNMEGTANVVNLSLAYNIEKLVYVSSIAAIGRKMRQQKITEQSAWETSKFNTQYGISKFRAEREVWRGIAEGLNAVMVNPSIVLGAGHWNDSSVRLFHQVHQGWHFYPEGVTGYVDVRDVVAAMVQLMDSDISEERFILSAEDWDYKRLFTTIAKHLGKKPPSFKVNRRLALAAYRILGLGYPLIQRDLVINIGNRFYYDASKIRNAINMDFIPIDQTIRETATAMKTSLEAGRPFGWLPEK